MLSFTSTTSLQQLQAIEQEFTGLEAQVSRLAEILGCACDNVTYTDAKIGVTKSIGRLDWGLRWLLNKLQADGALGLQARRLPKAWILLTNIVSLLQPSQTARALSSNRIIPVIQKSLSENFDEARKDGETAKFTEPDVDDAFSAALSNGISSKSSKKRKRSDKAEHNSTCTKRWAPDQSGLSNDVHLASQAKPLQSLLHAISALTTKLLELARNEDGALDHYSCEYMRAALVVSTPEALGLMRSWLMALVSCLKEQDKKASNSTKEDLTQVYSLSSVVHIWASRSRKAEGSMAESAIAFSAAILVPATQFLYQLRRLCDERTQSLHRAEHFREEMTTIERLLAEHIFIPAKRNFQESQRTSTPTDNSAVSEFLSKIMQPLSKELLPDSPQLSGIPLLFDIVIRCSPVSGARRKPRESAWLQAVFEALAACLGFGLSVTNETEIPLGYYKLFETLLSMAARAKIMLSSSLLEYIARDVAGLHNITKPVTWEAVARQAVPGHQALSSHEAVSGHENMRWALLEQVLALDHNVFLNSRATSTSDEGGTSNGLSEMLVSAINAQPCAFRQIRGDTDPSAHEEDHDTQLYQLIKRGIILPLIKAYAAARDLRGFLDRWHKQLLVVMKIRFRDSSEDSSTNRISVSIWEDSALDMSLQKYLTTSFTTKQLKDIVMSLNADLQVDEPLNLDENQMERAATSAHILRAIIGALDDDATEQELLALIGQILITCAKLLISPRSCGHDAKAKFWALTAACHKFAFEVSDLETLVNIQPTSNQLMFLALQSLPVLRDTGSPVEGLAALACLGSIMQDLHQRHLGLPEGFQEAYGKVLPLCYSKRVTKRITCFCADIGSEYPCLLDATVGNERVSTFDFILQHTSNQADLVRWRGVCTRILENSTMSSYDFFQRLDGVRVQLGADRSMYNREHEDNIATALREGVLHIEPAIASYKNKEDLIQVCSETVNSIDSMLGGLCLQLSLLLYRLAFPGGMNKNDSVASALHEIYDNMNGNSIMDDSTAFEALSSLVLLKEVMKRLARHDESITQSKQSQEAMGKLIESATTFLRDVNNETLNDQLLEEWPLLRPWYLILCTSLSGDELRAKVGNVPKLKIVSDEQLRQLRKQALSAITEVVENLSHQNEPQLFQVALTYASLDALATSDISLQPKERQDLEKQLQALHAIFLPQASSTDSEVRYSYSLLLALIYRVRQVLNLSQSSLPDTPGTLLALSSISLAPARQDVYHMYIERFNSLNDEEKVDVLQKLIAPVSDQTHASESLQLLQCVINASTIKEHSELLPPLSIPRMTVALAQRLSHTTDSIFFTYIADTLALLLQQHSKHQTQFAIETTLQAIATVCSPAGPELPSTAAANIFSRLATLLQYLLTYHRRALRGRFDLVTLALQTLLRCLFIPTARTGKALHHAPWAASNLGSAFPASTASLYTRLLTSFCDPTYASVRPSYSKNSRASETTSNLTDVTKKARAYAAQYAPLVLLDLCRCMLVGRLADGVREQLMPGVWAIFEICGRDMLAAAAAGAGAGERAVLRSLREEWRRNVGGRAGKR